MGADLPTGARRTELATLLRFCLVGGASTLVFAAVSWLLIWLELIPAALVNVAAIAAGIAASYAGHYYFTYRVGGGQHAFFGPRFFVVTAILGTASVAFTHVSVENFRVSPYIVSMLVSILYPVASLLLHHFWTFARS
jgi:putative flippase GtrA